MLTLDEAVEGLRGLAERVRPRTGHVRLDGDLLVIDHPRARGALTVEMMLELSLCVRTLQASRLPAVAIRSAHPGMFCSGGHLGQVREALIEPGAGLAMARCMTAVLDALAELPCRVVALVDGPALGGGAELVTAADDIVVGPTGSIGFVHTRLGVAPGWGGALRLTRRVGPSTALHLLGEAPTVDAERAAGLGLALAVPSTDTWWSELTHRLHGRSVDGLHAAKRQILHAHPLGRHDDAEARLFAEVWGSAAHRDALE